MAIQTNQLGLFNFELNPKVYGSGYYDSESNLQYMGARYYSADTQRFMAQDSYNLLNRYNYANGNPVMNYDPDGHLSIPGIINAVRFALNVLSTPGLGGVSYASVAGVIGLTASIYVLSGNKKASKIYKKSSKLLGSISIASGVLALGIRLYFGYRGFKMPLLIPEGIYDSKAELPRQFFSLQAIYILCKQYIYGYEGRKD